MTFDALGVGALDYERCEYGTSKLSFRGPKRRLAGDYAAFIGGTETFGKFIEQPFPYLIEKETGLKCVNFGFPNAGVDAFLHDPYVPEAIASAKVVVIQTMGAQNMSNRFYSVHPRRNDRFVAPSLPLQTIFRDVDFSEYDFTKHMLSQLSDVSAMRFDLVRQELKQAWVARMKLLLQQLKCKTVLLWFAPHSPEQDEQAQDFGTDPMFVSRDMIEDLRSVVTEVVEVVASPAAIAMGSEGMVFTELEAPAAAHVMGPAAHEEAAIAVGEVVARLHN